LIGCYDDTCLQDTAALFILVVVLLLLSSSSGLATVITQGFAALLCGLDGDNLFLIWCVDVSDLLLIPMHCL